MLDLRTYESFIASSKFLDNKYSRWYYNIVVRRSEQPFQGVFEQHHILPQSFGLCCDDTVLLSLKEHYILHLLLTKMVTNTRKKKMIFALMMMSSTRGDLKCNSTLYSAAKAERSRLMHLTTDVFIERAKDVHSDLYDYSKVEYVRNDIPVTIICRAHGEFLQKPIYHLGGSKCQKCTKNTKMDNDTFLQKARSVHGDSYGYDKCAYDKSSVKIIVTCYLHGDFQILPASHLRGAGCKFCGYLRASKKISEKMIGNIPWNKKI